MRKLRQPGFPTVLTKGPWALLPPLNPKNNDLILSGPYTPPAGDDVDLVLTKG